MIKKITPILLSLIIFASCGKSKEEIELEKAKIELEKTKLELAEKIKQEENSKSVKIHEQKVNVGKRKKITELTIILQKLPEAIKKAQANIDQINKFKFGRLSSTKNRQLSKARSQLNELYDYRKKIKNEIAQTEYLKTFDFQQDPKRVMEYIFDSCKKQDFSNFRNLCDPYGEHDSDVKQICFAEMMLDKKQKLLHREFKNGRIIGEPKITGDKAEVEFAFGYSANKLEKMKMIKRNGLWYLKSF